MPLFYRRGKAADDAAGARGPDRHGGSLGPGQGACGEHQTSKLVHSGGGY